MPERRPQWSPCPIFEGGSWLTTMMLVTRGARPVNARMWRMLQRASISTTSVAQAIKEFAMPAMSPTMEHGSLGQWKVKEGSSFSMGDVLVEVETDKAMMDVEAPEDGVLAKIIYPSGSKDIKVNTPIAFLAEEGDDLSDVPDVKPSAPSQSQDSRSESEEREAPPKDEPASSRPSDERDGKSEASEPVQLSKPALPSVLRLLHENHISDAEDKIRGTGLHGMLTKGDVLAYLGKIKSPFGTAKPHHTTMSELGGPREEAPKEAKPAQPQVRVIFISNPS